MSILSSAQVTLAWSAGILATIRYYQLASPTTATPAVPASSSSLGSWTETEPAADVTKVLWTCERTVYADGTESWSKASKSTSYEAAKDAKGTANVANSTAQTAKSAADTAKSTADAAKSSAATANNTANAAKTAAANAQTSADKAQASADDTAAALAKAAVRIRIDGTPMADGTSQLMAHVYVGNDEVGADAIAKLGTLVWKMDGVADRRGTTTYTAQTGKFVTCRLEA